MDAGSELAILVVAAGRGSRAGAGLPKQYRSLAGRPILAHSLSSLLRAAPNAIILPVIHKDDLDLYRKSVSFLDAGLACRLKGPVYGGATRQASVLAGLEGLQADSEARPEFVFIHDAARLFAGEALVARALAAAKAYGAAIPGVAVTDTIKEVDPDHSIIATPARTRLRAVQNSASVSFRSDPGGAPEGGGRGRGRPHRRCRDRRMGRASRPCF